MSGPGVASRLMFSGTVEVRLGLVRLAAPARTPIVAASGGFQGGEVLDHLPPSRVVGHINVGAFGQFESRQVTRFDVEGQPLGAPVTFVNVLAPDLRTPEAVAGNVEWNQRFGRRVLFKN